MTMPNMIRSPISAFNIHVLSLFQQQSAGESSLSSGGGTGLDDEERSLSPPLANSTMMPQRGGGTQPRPPVKKRRAPQPPGGEFKQMEIVLKFDYYLSIVSKYVLLRELFIEPTAMQCLELIM